MKSSFITPMLLAIALGVPTLSQAATCTYLAHITDEDKINSSGEYIGTGYNKNTVAQFIRQDRANFYNITGGTAYDESDCMFASANARAKIPQMVNRGYVSPSTIRSIVDGEAYVKVSIQGNKINITMAE